MAGATGNGASNGRMKFAARIQSIEKESRRRSVAIVGSGAVLVPSWLAVAWYLPDFRLLASIGVGTALWILYHMYRDTAASGWRST